ncbi:hypothetical protein C8J56DRAFT_1081440 [Mycena floridula]|nr:hypothetical protein C8J56DRAFT_1081440 [Mycena floridula]
MLSDHNGGFNDDFMGFYEDSNPGPVDDRDYDKRSNNHRSNSNYDGYRRGRGKQRPPRYFEDRNSSGREGHGPRNGRDNRRDERNNPSRDYSRSRPYPAEEEHRNLRSPSHPDSARSEPQPREPTFEETMEADVANFKPSLSSPSSIEDAQELMKLAEDPSICRIDAVRILLNEVDRIQWTPTISPAASHILRSQWRPAA